MNIATRRRVGAGKILLNRGNLTGALVLFDEASDLLSCKTDAGGAAHLQKAITLDSLGKNQEALKIYRQLRGHRCIEVAKMVCPHDSTTCGWRLCQRGMLRVSLFVVKWCFCS